MKKYSTTGRRPSLTTAERAQLREAGIRKPSNAELAAQYGLRHPGSVRKVVRHTYKRLHVADEGHAP
jgi:hypothetical protein